MCCFNFLIFDIGSMSGWLFGRPQKIDAFKKVSRIQITFNPLSKKSLKNLMKLWKFCLTIKKMMPAYGETQRIPKFFVSRSLPPKIESPLGVKAPPWWRSPSRVFLWGSRAFIERRLDSCAQIRYIWTNNAQGACATAPRSLTVHFYFFLVWDGVDRCKSRGLF